MLKQIQAMRKKGQLLSGFNVLLGVVFILLILSMVLAFGSGFIADQKADLTTDYGENSTAVLVLEETEAANQELAEAQGTLVKIGIISIVILVLMGLYVTWKRNNVTM